MPNPNGEWVPIGCEFPWGDPNSFAFQRLSYILSHHDEIVIAYAEKVYKDYSKERQGYSKERHYPYKPDSKEAEYYIKSQIARNIRFISLDYIVLFHPILQQPCIVENVDVFLPDSLSLLSPLASLNQLNNFKAEQKSKNIEGILVEKIAYKSHKIVGYGLKMYGGKLTNLSETLNNRASRHRILKVIMKTHAASEQKAIEKKLIEKGLRAGVRGSRLQILGKIIGLSGRAGSVISYLFYSQPVGRGSTITERGMDTSSIFSRMIGSYCEKHYNYDVYLTMNNFPQFQQK